MEALSDQADAARAVAGREAPLCSALITLIDEFRASIDGSRAVADQLNRHRQRLEGPLHVALSGAVSIGKSTALNCLVGREIAPTGEKETTRIVTWYHGGDVEYAELWLRDGSRRQVHFELDGTLPATLGVPAENIDALHVTLPSSSVLDGIVLLDTPGLFSVRDENSSRTRGVLLGEGGAAEPDVDALLFFINGQQDEVDMLAGFLEEEGMVRPRAGSVLGVVNKVDRIGDERPPLVIGRDKAARLMSEHQVEFKVARILPMIGLLAESVLTGRVRDRHRLAMRAYGEFWDGEAPMSVNSFLKETEPRLDIPRGELVDVFDLYGLGLAVRLALECDSPTQFTERLLEESGYPSVLTAVQDLFVQRSDVLKASRAMNGLKRVSYQMGALGERLRSALEELELSPEGLALAEVEALGVAANAHVEIPGWLKDALRNMTGYPDPARRLGLPMDTRSPGLVETAGLLLKRLRAFSNSPTAGQEGAYVADVLTRSCRQVAVEADEMRNEVFQP